MNIEIANRLVELRKQKGLSQEALAQELGISRQAVSKWERAESSPDTDNLICLAKLYGVSLDTLLETSSSIEEIKEEQIKEDLSAVEDPEYDKDDYDSDKDYGKLHKIINSITPLLAVISFLLLGLLYNYWHPGWVVFLLIPVIPSLIAAIKERNGKLFCYPVFVVLVYVLLSDIFSIWHPLWIVFLTIPIYYAIFDVISKK